ncbi:MAG: FAD-binding protein [Clostridia bacterium]|nr:FAD-binding protein [Clostridia bacterium]
MKRILSTILALMIILTSFGAAFAEASYTPGTYQATTKGASGDVSVEVTFDETSITSVVVTAQTETTDAIARVMEEIPAAIVAAQTAEVDVFTGATISSKAIMTAAANAIAQASGIEIEEASQEEQIIVEKPEIAIPVGVAAVSDYSPDVAYEDTIAWDLTYDVVVAGYGAAGATSAISAADAGASVLLLEKAPKGQEGGNSKFAGQDVLGPDDRDKAVAYYTALRGLFTESTSDSMIEAYVDACMENPDYLQSLGAKYEEFWIKSWPEFPEFEGSESIYTWIVGGQSFQGTLYKLLQDNVNLRDIDVLYSAEATHLIQDPASKVILGVQFEKDGRVVNARAKNGVVLCTGGFEANQEMIQNFLQQPYVYVVAARYNTGDGIKMAMEVGADLWHMSNSAGFSWGFQPEGQDTCVRNLTLTNGIFVGTNAERFMNETASSRHGKINYGGRWISMPTPLPAYYIFDENARLTAPVSRNWTEGNVDEIEKGWIVKADTIEELAEKLNLDAETLCATVEKYNGYCANGEDVQYGRAADRLVPVEKGPFYALELGPTMLNTQGGPKRNEQAQILDVNGDPIPHLYSAGELGAMFADMYNGGGNLGECVAFGRIAGRNAAEPKAE